MPRPSKLGNDTAVQGTNDSSIVSKCSTATQGYFQDDFLQLFVSKTARRAPLINRGYYIRARAIDDLLKQFLCLHHGEKQIISLGAGFDSAFFRLHASGLLVDTTFYEVDFPDVVRRKATIIKSSDQLRQQLGDEVDQSRDVEKGIYLMSAGYRLLGVDLTDLHLLEFCLNLTGINYTVPTLLMSECVLTYMEVRNSDAVIRWASSSFSNAIFLTYEQIHPDDAFGLVMQKHFVKLNSPLKAIQTYPTTEAQQQRFLNLGWQGTSAIDMNSYYARLPVKERQRVESLEPFDEFEEWHLKCSHYAVVSGLNGDCCNMRECFGKDHRPTTDGDLPGTLDHSHPSSLAIRPLTSTHSRPVRRFGHASARLSLGKAIVVGGFGEAGTKHTRLGDVVIVDLKTGHWDTVPASLGIPKLGPRMHHTLTAISGGDRWFLFGGRSSPATPSNSSLILSLNTEQRCAAVPQTDVKMSTVSSNVPVSDDGNMVSSSHIMDIEGEKCSARCNLQTGVTCADNIGSNLGSDGFDETLLKAENSKTVSSSENFRNSETRLPLKGYATSETVSYSCRHIKENSHVPNPRWRHSAVCASISCRECIVIYGGRGTGDDVFGDCWVLDVGHLQWQRLRIAGDQPPASHSHTACVWQDTRMVLAGGLGPALRPLTGVYVIDLEVGRCQEIKPRPTLPPRYSHTAHVVGHSLVLVGGVNPLAAHSYTVAVVDLEASTWRRLSLPAFALEHPLMVHGHTSELYQDTSIVVLGGGGNCFSFGTHLNGAIVEIRVPLM